MRSTPHSSLLWVVLLTALSCGDGLHSGPLALSDSSLPRPVTDASIVDSSSESSCSGPLQTGCSTGQKCAFVQLRWKCVAEGPKQRGEACHLQAQGDTCNAGLHCYQGVCNPICENNSHCAYNDTCVAIVAGGEPIAICLAPCDSLAQDCSDLPNGNRQGCYLHISGASVCSSPDSPPTLPGNPCSYLNECAIGAGCVVSAGQSICRAYCDYESNANKVDAHCSSVQNCQQLGDLSLVGVCQ